jgi:hypothetical protein
MTTVLHRGAEPEVRVTRVDGRVGAAGLPEAERDGDLVRDDARTAPSPPTDLVDEWGVQSFPASDPPPTW